MDAPELREAGPVTQLLAQARGGDRGAMDRLFALVYEELRAHAHRRRLFQGGGDDLLNTTALVHEAYLKMTEPASLSYQDRAHFFAVAARAMRQILVDAARRRKALKRGGGVSVEALDEASIGTDDHATELLALDVALTQLAVFDDRLSRLVELRFFAGLSVEETAEVLELSPRTVKRDWRKARALLYDALQHGVAVV
jgi:RNA polymerase sigma factor (TIGR02999 family)